MAKTRKARSLYINRELSWLEFNSRVLHEALDGRNPLLERLNFIAIFSKNMDEYYMTRVAGLRRQVYDEEAIGAPDELTPIEQLDAIADRESALRRLQMSCLHRELLPLLAEKGVELITTDDLSSKELMEATDYFERDVLP